MSKLLAIFLLIGTLPLGARSAPATPFRLQTENVFLIVSDGFRWQEVFQGAEEILMTKTNGGVVDIPGLRTNFWRETAEARRAALLPFFWNEIALRGQLYGNQTKGSIAKVTNDRRFSYPGYNEMLTGAPDPRITSNDKKPNPNVTVFEWLQSRPGFRERVVVFGTWDAFPYIFNCERNHLPIWPAWDPKFQGKSPAASPLLEKLLADTTPVFEEITLDSFLIHAALDHVKAKKTRLVFVGFGETDEWAHAGRYDLYLKAAHHFDHFTKTLWDTVQSMPRYRNKTTFLLTADHGRGTGLTEWKDHGEKIPSSDGIWLAVLGPDTPALGERTQTGPIMQSQIAATLAALLGEDFRAAFPRAGAPLGEVFGSGPGLGVR